ncbi:hypothetical protein CEP54_006436 [Fusarium duplospermum]|uniref:TauD/TfdA-like domain-containing protein n=1 Tax=Fusarium duplospermum TaxID=1325734 RepID=A0A428Q6Y7_9HYPO|nr:hypothetical protein CEP54_006436 [Fusarium duplospermum]
MSTAITENIILASVHLSVNELKSGFGAEIHGLDFANGATEEDGRLIEELVKKYGVIVLRRIKLVDETHIQLARMLGELDDVKPYNKAGRKNRLNHDELFDVGNIESDGSIVSPDSPRA